MTAETRDTLFRVALPLLTIAVIVFAARAQDISFRDHLGLRFPSWGNALLWLLLFLGLVVVEEVLRKTWGLPDPVLWGSKYSGVVKAMRVFAMIALAPVAEELVFRGMLYYTLSKTALTEVGAVGTTSVAFAALHYQVGVRGMLFVLVDGLFFGIVRYSTGSTVLTAALHSLGNSYAAYQRL
jgi:membrane protease YdiL (CAAX protease family)